MNQDNVALMRKAKAQLSNHWLDAVLATLIYIVISAAAGSTGIVALIIEGPLTFGYILYLACLADTGNSKFELLFQGFNRFVETLIAGLIVSVITAVGTALLIVPGIIAATGLSMTFFIMADDPNISGIDAVKLSWKMMNGHKANLFCFWLRFIGWLLLCILTCGIGILWLNPYITLSTLNYYRRLRYGTF